MLQRFLSRASERDESPRPGPLAPDYPSLERRSEPDYPSLERRSEPDYPALEPANAAPDYPALEAEHQPDYPALDGVGQAPGYGRQIAVPARGGGGGHSLGSFGIDAPSPDPALDGPPAPVPLPGLRGITPDPKYAGEDQRYGWRADNVRALRDGMASEDPAERDSARQQRDALAARTDLARTTYLTEGQRRERQIDVGGDGLLRRADGDLMDTSRGGGGGLSPTDGREIFALGVDGALNAADGSNFRGLSNLSRTGEGHLQGEAFHHSAFYDGGAVAGAGEISVEDGQLRAVSDQSGHYRPDAGITHQAVSHLAGAGVKMVDDTPDASGAPINRPVQVHLGGKNPGESEVTLTHQQFLQTMGNEPQIRAKQGLNAEIEAAGGLTPSQRRAAAPAPDPISVGYADIDAERAAQPVSGYGQPIPAPPASGYGQPIPVPPASGYGEIIPVRADDQADGPLSGLASSDFAPMAPPPLRRVEAGRHRRRA